MSISSLTTMVRRVSIGGVIGLWFLAMTSAAKADIRVDRTDPPYGKIFITGRITKENAKTFDDISNELQRYSYFTVRLNSEGGDVSAAIEIGRLIRKYEGFTTIEKNGRCYSSCALIFIAGVSRSNYGELGLHRPYLAAAPQSRETVQQQVPLMLSMVKSYVAEMGITENFYQQMVNTEPSKIAIYSENNYQTLVPSTDPTHDELRIAHVARQYGASTSEMRRREKEADGLVNKGLCEANPHTPPISGTILALDCEEAIKWGLSESVYRERFGKANSTCLLSDEEEKTKKTMRFTLAWDLPFVIRQETCIRNIMLGR
jgi:hypothetical protein